MGVGIAGFPISTDKGNPDISESLERLLERRDKCSAELKGLLYESDDRPKESITRAEEKRANELLDEIKEFDQRLEEERDEVVRQKQLTEARRDAGVSVSVRGDGVTASVTGEPMIYGTDSPNSYYFDQLTLDRRPVTHPAYRAAFDRMMAWSNQVEHEVADRTDFGRRAERQVREFTRIDNPQVHATTLAEIRDRGRFGANDKEVRTGIGTGGGATASASGGGGAAFVTPVFASSYVPYREYGRAFAQQCASVPLPDYGMAIYKPRISGPAGVSQFTEVPTGTAGVTEVDPTAAYLVANLAIFAGQVTLSQAIIDRTSPDFRFDVACEDQLRRDYDPKFDQYVLAQSLANATSQNWTGNSNQFVMTPPTGSLPGAGGFYGQVSKAKAAMRKLAGTVLNPTHLFLDPARYELMASWADSQGRPLIVPDYAGPFNALGNSGDGDAGIEGYTGTRFNGLPVFTDANLPTTGGTANLDQAIVGCLQEVEVYEGSPVNRVLPQTLATTLSVVLQRYSYAAVLVNYTAAVTSINGTGFSAISYTD